MPLYLDTRGHTTLAVGICARCSVKYPLDELRPDPNSPGLLCCPDGCLDDFDPYRLPPRGPDRIAVENPRPDVALTTDGLTLLFGPNQLNPVVNNLPLLDTPVTALGPVRKWQPNTWYNKGDTITPEDIDADTTVLPQVWVVCLESGWSMDTPPSWPAQTGVPLREGPPASIGGTSAAWSASPTVVGVGGRWRLGAP